MNISRLTRPGIALGFVFSAMIGTGLAQSSGSIPAAPKQDLGSAMQNPIGAIYSLPLEITTDFGAENGDATFIQFQPVYPVSLGDWNIVNRTIIPFIDAPGGRPGSPGNPSPEEGERAFGLGDIMHTSFFSPAKAGKVIWGVGPVINLPTATADVLGSGKWSAGASVVLLTTPKPWVFGMLLGNMWSFAGDDDRDDISATFLQPFLTYITKTKTTFALNTESTYDWKADEWSVPINFNVLQLLKIGPQIIQVGVGARYWADSPDNGPSGWGARFQLTFLFPK